MNTLKVTTFCLLALLPLTSHADPISDIIKYLTTIEKFQKGIQGDQDDIDTLTKQLEKDMRGQYGWGTRNFQDHDSWGFDAQNWQNILNVAKNGGSTSELGQSIQQLANQFPINSALVNQVDRNAADQQYYALQANTALVARAASELDYNNIQKQIDYQKNLQQNIESTQNVKAALDLQNRLQVENNLIQLEMLRQLALINQQQAVQSQADVNNTIKDAYFLKSNP